MNITAFRKLRNPKKLQRNISIFSGINAFEYAGGSQINPATIFAHVLETINSVSGFGWPATIISFTLGMRLLIFPSYLKQIKSTIMASNLKDEISSFQTKIQSFRANNQFPEARQELQQMYTFLRKNNCHPIRTIVLSLFPIPFFMSTFFALRNMANQPIESFIDGGAGWFMNLAESDPLLILPIISCASLLISFEISRKNNTATIPAKMVNILRLMSIFSLPILSYMPSSLCIYFITTNFFTLMQNIVLCIPNVRRVLKIPSIEKSAPTVKKPERLFESFKSYFKTIQSTQENNLIVHSTKPFKNI